LFRHLVILILINCWRNALFSLRFKIPLYYYYLKKGQDNQNKFSAELV
jgi:hypothetical protein